MIPLDVVGPLFLASHGLDSDKRNSALDWADAVFGKYSANRRVRPRRIAPNGTPQQNAVAIDAVFPDEIPLQLLSIFYHSWFHKSLNSPKSFSAGFSALSLQVE